MNSREITTRVRGPKPIAIELSDRQRSLLEQMTRRQTSPQYQVRRAELILSMDGGSNNQQTARQLGVHRETVQQWRNRWLAEVPRLTAAELSGVSDKELQSMMAEVLMDEPRDGAPVKFTAEQVTQIIAIACEHPQPSERPISQWSAEEIAQEAIQRGIVETISARSVQRFLKRSGLETPSQPVLAQRQSSRPAGICPAGRSSV